MNYIHFAHNNVQTVYVGQIIKRGQVFAQLGDTGLPENKPNAHLHIELRTKEDFDQRGPTAYTYGLTLRQAMEKYPDISQWLKDKHPVLDNGYIGGYGYMDAIPKGGWHGGLDYSTAAGDADIGSPIYAPCDMEIVWAGKNSGWGLHCYAKEVQLNNNDEHMDCVKKDDRYVQQVGGKNSGAIHMVNDKTMKRFMFVEKTESEKAGVAALAKMAGRQMSPDEIKRYERVDRLAEVS